MIFQKNPIYSGLSLIVCFFAIAGNYVLLGAQFLAMVHVIVYAGAIMVLFLFVIMLMNLNKDTEVHKGWKFKLLAVTLSGLFGVTLLGVFRGFAIQSHSSQLQIGYAKSLGRLLFSDYLIPFELSSVLFLASIIGVVLLGKRHSQDDK